MNFTIPKAELSAALARCAAIAPVKSSLPILSSVRLDPRGNYLHVEATDLEVGYHTVITGIIWHSDLLETAQPFLLPAKRLHEIVKAIPIGEVTISVTDYTATISGGTVTYILAGLPADEFPAVPALVADGLTFVPHQLATALKSVAYAQSADASKYNLNGVFIKLEANLEASLFVIACATDGHRLCLTSDCIDDGEDEALQATGDIPDDLARGIIIPAKGIAELVKLSGSDPGVISMADNTLAVSLGDEVISIRLVDGDFPDYNRVIPQNPQHLIVAKRQSLVDALERCRVITDKDTRKVTLALADGALAITSARPSIGAEASDRITAAGEGEPPEIYLNIEYLLQALHNITSTTIELRITDVLSPVILSPWNSDGTTAIIMPMRGE